MINTLPITDAQALDHFIAGNVPEWLKNAPINELDELRESLVSHHRHQARVSELLARIQAPEDFALPRLAGVLRELGCDPQPRQALWRDVRLRVEQPVFRVTDMDLPIFRHYSVESGLLPRLLHNFNKDEASAGYYYPGAGILVNGKLLACPPDRVAARCRELDVGGKYQKHLNEVLAPEDAGQRQQVLDLLRDDKRATLAAHARCAYLKGHIDLAARRMLLDLATGSLVLAGARSQVRAGRLQLLGFEVADALLLEVSAEAGFDNEPSLAGQVVLCLSSDPNRPIRQCASLERLNDELLADLRSPPYADYFTRQLPRDDRLSFIGKLQACLQHARVQLHLKGVGLDEGPFEAQARRQIARIKADAERLLVPTAAVDQALHHQRIEALKSAGLTVTGVLASFIPGVGEMMLAGLVKDLLGEVCEGVVDWSHGQREEALDHVFGVLANVALGALVAAGAAVTVRELRRSAFVDALRPVVPEGGGRRLWSAERANHHVALALPPGTDPDGFMRVHGRHWWRCDDQVFEVRRTSADARWRIVHPLRSDAWTPELTGNGDGAWWHAGEDPLQWQGCAYLLRRLGPRSAGLSDRACEQVATICGYDDARLRRLLVERRRMPVELVQVLADFSLEARVSGFFEGLARGAGRDELDAQLCRLAAEVLGSEVTTLWQARAGSLRLALVERVSRSAAPALSAAGEQLHRVFPGLPERFVEALLEEGGPPAAGGRIPLALQEQAHRVLREVRVLRALEGLYLDSRCGSDTVRLVFSLFRRLARWPQGLTFELHEGAFAGPVLERVLPLADVRQVKVLVVEGGCFRAFDTAGNALGEQPADLFRALADGLGAEHCATLGCAGSDAAEGLRTLLREEAVSDRERLPGLLGISTRPAFFRTPQRLADGRSGYPLSGRGLPGRVTLTGMVRSLYPGFSELDASVWLDEIQQLHGDPMGELLRAQESLRTLDAVLDRWRQAVNVFNRRARRRVADEIRRCWCRQTPAVLDSDGRISGYRLHLDRSTGGDLPELPPAVDFSHVVELGLSSAGQSGRIDGFLQRFPRLRWLDLGVNGCNEIPAALAGMRELRELRLDSNHIQWNDACQATLLTLSRLEVLSLDRNPLGRAPDVSHLMRLRRLSLRSTGLSSLPQGMLGRPFLEIADLRGNQLVTLPDAFFVAPPQIRSAVVLFDNPFPQEVRDRLWQALVADDLRDAFGGADSVREQWLSGMHDDLLRVRDTQWQSLRAEAGSDAFFTLLANLLDTAEYRLAASHLRERVWEMIGAAVENTALRESLFELANAPTTCVDSISSSFSVLDVHLQVSQAAARVPATDRGAALLAFARRLFRLDCLQKHALQVINQRRVLGEQVDEVEVSLAFCVRLAQTLELPGQPRHMQFGIIAGVSDMDLRYAQEVVETAETGPQLADFIARQDFWDKYLREQHGAEFRNVEARFWGSLERLCEEQAQLSEGDYLQRMNQLGKDREAALHALARTLTEQALKGTTAR